MERESMVCVTDVCEGVCGWGGGGGGEWAAGADEGGGWVGGWGVSND